MKRKTVLVFLLGGIVLNAVAQSVVAQDVVVYPQFGHTDHVSSVAFSPDGTQALSGSLDCSIKLWDIASGREIRTFLDYDGYVLSVAFSPDGTQAVSGSSSGAAKLWDIATGQEIRSFLGHTDWVSYVAFSPDGKQILSCSYDGTLKLWDIDTGREIKTFSGHTDNVNSLAFNPDGSQAISGSSDGTAMLWDIATGQEIKNFSGNAEWVTSVAFSPDGRQFFALVNGAIKLWDVETGQVLRTFPVDEWVTAIALSPDGKMLLLSSVFDGDIILFDIAKGRATWSFSGHTDGVNSLMFSPDGKTFLSGSRDYTMKLWNIDTRQEIKTFGGQTNFIFSVGASADGEQVFSGYGDGAIKLWDAVAGREIKDFIGHIDPVSFIGFSPDKNQIFSESGGTIKLWDMATGQEIISFLLEHDDWVSSVVVSADGKHILSGSGDNTVKLWDPSTGSELRTFSGHTESVYSIGVSPDGNQIVSGTRDGTIKLWDLVTGREIRTFSGDADAVFSIGFSPDGKQVITGLYDNSIKLWDVNTGQAIRTFLGHYGLIGSVAFSPDGKQILSGSNDGSAKLWDIETGREITTFLGHSNQIFSVAFIKDGKQVITGSADGSIKIWDISTGQEIASFISFSGSDTQLTANSRGIKRASEEKAAEINGEWICITPDGYYAASPRGDRYLNVRSGNRVTGIDSFRHIFYRPDIVEARLAGRPDPISANTINIQDAAAFFPATVTLNAPSTTTSGIADIAVSITDDNQPLQSIKIIVNGRLVGGEELRAVTGAQGLTAERASIAVVGDQKSLSFTVPLALDPGNNLVELIAYNGYAESRQKINVEWVTDSDYKPALPNLWLLAIGVNEYDDEGITNLTFCAKDAGEIVNSFKAQEGRRYAKVNSLLMADGEALAPNANNVRESLGFLEGAGPRDIVLLFMAGHGVNGPDGVFCYLPKDARENPDGSFFNVITGDEINRVLDSPGNRLIFIDACHSGSMDNDRMLRLFMDTNAYVFAACRGNELSYEPPELGHGIFTYSIVNTLKDPDARASGSLSVLGLSSQVSMDVPRKLKELWYPEQNPVGYSLGFYDFVIGE